MVNEQLTQDAIALGNQFKATRELNNITLSQVSAQLEIRSVILNDMEKGRFLHLKRGDCLAYARYLGLNIKEVAVILDRIFATSASSAMGSYSKVKVAVGAVTAILLVLVITGVYSCTNKSTEEQPALVNPNASEEEELPLQEQTRTMVQVPNSNHTLEVVEEVPTQQVTAEENISLPDSTEIHEEVIIDNPPIKVAPTSPVGVEMVSQPVSPAPAKAQLTEPTHDTVKTSTNNSAKTTKNSTTDSKTTKNSAKNSKTTKNSAKDSNSTKSSVKNSKATKNSTKDSAKSTKTTKNSTKDSSKTSKTAKNSTKDSSKTAKTAPKASTKTTAKSVATTKKTTETKAATKPVTATKTVAKNSPLKYGEIRSLGAPKAKDGKESK